MRLRKEHILLESLDGIEDKIISFNFSNAKNIFPKAEDKIIISSKIDLTRTQNVSIEGEVSEPNELSIL